LTFSDILGFLERVLRITFFTVNNTPVTLGSFFVFLVIFLGFYVASRILTRILGSRVLARFHMEPATRYTLQRITHYLLVIIGAIVAFQFIGINLSGLAVIFGLLSVGIGFGLQNITSNFIAGLILLFERPIKVGDRVTVGDTEGDVLAINMRATTIRSLNNIAIIVPNSEFISGRVTNWSYGDKRVRLDIGVGVSYGSDLEAVVRSLREVAIENERILKEPAPAVLHLGFGDSAWNMQLRCWIADPTEHWTIRSELNSAIVGKFRKYGVEIPFPQRDLHVRSSVPLPVREPE
jgi:small-conductance mechanosensitive channel